MASPHNKLHKDGSTLRSAQCTIVETKGSTPRRAGVKMCVWENGDTTGTIGGGNLEKKVIENAREQIKKGVPKLFRHDLLHQHNMCCGGTVYIYVEPKIMNNKLYIFGAGHTGKALATLASNLDFDIYVVDDRPEYIRQIEPASVNKLEVEYRKVLQSLPYDENTYIVIMTYDHAFDREILAYCISQSYAYLGMIGSRRKVELTRKMFAESGAASQHELDKVDMPMGLNIQAEGPQEIAVSILGKLIEVKNGK